MIFLSSCNDLAVFWVFLHLFQDCRIAELDNPPFQEVFGEQVHTYFLFSLRFECVCLIKIGQCHCLLVSWLGV